MARSVPKVSSEFEGAEFGDARLTRRLLRIAECVATAPAAGFPGLSSSDSELEGVYRFLGNERVTPVKILQPHLAKTVERVGERPVLVLHDTTELGFGGQAKREGLGTISFTAPGQGFFAHFALALAADGSREPLGVAGLQTFVRTVKQPPKHWATRKAGTPNERSRWPELALQVGQTFPRAIHVMDREADSFEILSELSAAGLRFVVRISRDRRLLKPEGPSRSLLAAADRDEIFATRSVCLTRRPKSRTGRVPRPKRDERTATLRIRASTHEVMRPLRRALENYPLSLTVNLITVEEVNTPPGVEPVSWRLATTEPITTTEQVEAIVDAYRARWVIEEYFKALKTGCSMEKRQLESYRGLVNALAMFSVVAWRLLLLRSVARLRPEAPATETLTQQQLRVLGSLAKLDGLGALPRIRLPRSPTAHDALAAVARLGGHIKNNGPPGWMVLGRGYESLLLLELGWMARETCDQS
jgi:hypothetical protein